MSASTAVSPPKSKVGLTSEDEEAGARKQIRFFLLGQREALSLLRKRTVSAKVQDLAER